MLREVKPNDPVLIAALASAGLPRDDLTSWPFRYFNWENVAFGGIGEGADALIRSIVVLPEARKGLRRRPSGIACRSGPRCCVARLWLLTASAAPFFEVLGWRAMNRDSAPPQIAQSRQFSGLCPAAATLMARIL